MRHASQNVPAPKLFVHVGLPKTGTTSIQERLAREGDGGGKGIGPYYPARGRTEGFPGHHNLAYEIAGDARFSPATGGWREVLEELPAGRDVLLSSEELFNVFLNRPERGVRWLREASAAFDVHVVASVRSYPDYLDSLHTLHLRSLASAMTPDQFFAAQQRAIPRVVNAFMLLVAAVGAERVHVIRFDGERDAWSAFVSALGQAPPPEGTPSEGARSNARIGLSQAVALFRLAQHEPVRQRPWLERAVLAKMLIERLAPGPTRYTFQSPGVAAAIAREASAAFRYLDALLGTELAGLHRPTANDFVDISDPRYATDDVLQVVAEFTSAGGGTRDDGPTPPDTVRLPHD